MTGILREILSNGFVLLVPILIWNVAFASRLPPAFKAASFNKDVPRLILIAEGVFRTVVFLMPLVLRLDISTPVGQTGLIVFLAGVLVYFLSWVSVMRAPTSKWATSALGFCAPAYTPIIWLTGIGLTADSYYLDVRYSIWHFIIPASCFTLFHIFHTARVFCRDREPSGKSAKH